MDVIRSDEELRDFAGEHLIYEIQMLFYTAVRLGQGSFHDTFEMNALLESFTVHARALLSVFRPEHPRADDAIASQWVDDWVEPELTPLFELVHPRVGKEIAHLTWTRAGMDEEAKRWPIPAIAAEFAPIVERSSMTRS